MSTVRDTRNLTLVMPATLRWRIVGWIVLTTAMIVLSIILTAHSFFRQQVLVDANRAIVQEINEFRTFASVAIDHRTRRPFTSLTRLMERYMERQTPDWGEAFIAVTPTDVMFIDNASDDAGERLAGDRERLNRLLSSPDDAGVTSSPQGELRWGKTTVVDQHGQKGVLLVTQFVQGQLQAEHRDMMVLLGIMIGGMLLATVFAWVAAGRILAPVRHFSEISAQIGPFDLDSRLPEDSTDELGYLARAINGMLARISAAHASQRHVLSEALTQISDITAALAEPPPDAAQTRARYAMQVRRLRRLRDDLRLLLDSGRADFVHPRETTLGPFTCQLAQRLQQAFPTRHWQVQTADADARVMLDRTRIRQGMEHLAANALAHTRAGDIIDLGCALREVPLEGETGAARDDTVRGSHHGGPGGDAGSPSGKPDGEAGGATGGPGEDAHETTHDAPLRDASDIPGRSASGTGRTQHMASLWIANRGEILTAEQARAIFSTPARLRHECSTGEDDGEQPRMGIGLAVVTALAHAHGGYAWVESGPARGTVFGMDIPLTPPAVPPPPPSPASTISTSPASPGGTATTGSQADTGTLTIRKALSRET